MSAEQYPAFCEFSEQSCSNPDQVRRCTRGFGCFCAATPAVQKDCSWRTEWLKEKGCVSTRNTYDKLPDSQSRGRKISLATAKCAVIDCLMRFGGRFYRKKAWSFSMPLGASFLSLGHQGYGVYNLLSRVGVENLD